MKGIAVAGTILVDKIHTVDGYPKEGRLEQIRDTKLSVGGLVPNVGIDLKAISPDLPVVAYGRVGKDGDGEYLLSKLKEGGMVASKVVLDENLHTSFTDVISVSGGERTFFTYAGASGEFGYGDIDFDALDVKMFHLGYFLLLNKVDEGDGARILAELQKRGVTTSIDLVSEQSSRYEGVRPCLKFVDNLFVNELEGAALAGVSADADLGVIAKKLQAFGVRERVIIHKTEESVCLRGGKLTRLPSFKLPKGWIVGKTGAGDAFTAGCLTAIYEGKTDEEILDFARRCAAMSLRSENAVDAMRTKKEIYTVTEGLVC